MGARRNLERYLLDADFEWVRGTIYYFELPEFMRRFPSVIELISGAIECEKEEMK